MDETVTSSKSSLIWPIVLVVALLGVAAVVFFNSGQLSGFFGLKAPQPDSSADPSQYLSRALYFREAFQPTRTNYRIFEKAAQFTKKPVSEMPAYFNLKNEADIWSELPPVPKDFSEIAYMLAIGSFFAIDGLGEEYYEQPEFYPNFTNPKGGLRWWLEPDPTSWGSNGYGTYPAEQWTTLKKGETESFKATVFLYTSFGVQTYQGLTVYADSESQKYFDLTISPQTFLLGPSFPKFGKNWAQKVTIRGKLKPDTPKGQYGVALNVGHPPADKQSEWSLLHKNLYQDAANGIRPSGNSVSLYVKVE